MMAFRFLALIFIFGCLDSKNKESDQQYKVPRSSVESNREPSTSVRKLAKYFGVGSLGLGLSYFTSKYMSANESQLSRESDGFDHNSNYGSEVVVESLDKFKRSIDELDISAVLSEKVLFSDNLADWRGDFREFEGFYGHLAMSRSGKSIKFEIMDSPINSSLPIASRENFDFTMRPSSTIGGPGEPSLFSMLEFCSGKMNMMNLFLEPVQRDKLMYATCCIEDEKCKVNFGSLSDNIEKNSIDCQACDSPIRVLNAGREKNGDYTLFWRGGGEVFTADVSLNENKVLKPAVKIQNLKEVSKLQVYGSDNNGGVLLQVRNATDKNYSMAVVNKNSSMVVENSFSTDDLEIFSGSVENRCFDMGEGKGAVLIRKAGGDSELHFFSFDTFGGVRSPFNRELIDLSKVSVKGINNKILSLSFNEKYDIDWQIYDKGGSSIKGIVYTKDKSDLLLLKGGNSQFVSPNQGSWQCLEDKMACLFNYLSLGEMTQKKYVRELTFVENGSQDISKGEDIANQRFELGEQCFFNIPSRAFNIPEPILSGVSYELKNLPNGLSPEMKGNGIAGVPTKRGSWNVELIATYNQGSSVVSKFTIDIFERDVRNVYSVSASVSAERKLDPIFEFSLVTAGKVRVSGRSGSIYSVIAGYDDVEYSIGFVNSPLEAGKKILSQKVSVPHLTSNGREKPVLSVSLDNFVTTKGEKTYFPSCSDETLRIYEIASDQEPITMKKLDIGVAKCKPDFITPYLSNKELSTLFFLPDDNSGNLKSIKVDINKIPPSVSSVLSQLLSDIYEINSIDMINDDLFIVGYYSQYDKYRLALYRKTFPQWIVQDIEIPKLVKKGNVLDKYIEGVILINSKRGLIRPQSDSTKVYLFEVDEQSGFIIDNSPKNVRNNMNLAISNGNVVEIYSEKNDEVNWIMYNKDMKLIGEGSEKVTGVSSSTFNILDWGCLKNELSCLITSISDRDRLMKEISFNVEMKEEEVEDFFLVAGMPIASQTTFVNQNYFYRIPHSAFNTTESLVNDLTYSVVNMPAGFEVDGRTISGVPKSVRGWNVTIKAMYEDQFALNWYTLNVIEDPQGLVKKDVKEGGKIVHDFVEEMVNPLCEAKLNGEAIPSWIKKIGSVLEITPTIDHIGKHEIEMDCTGFIDGRSVEIKRTMELKVKGLKVAMDSEVDCTEDKLCSLPMMVVESEEENISFIVRSKGDGIDVIVDGEYEGSDPEKAMESLRVRFDDNYNGDTIVEVSMEDDEGSKWSQEIKSVKDKPY